MGQSEGAGKINGNNKNNIWIKLALTVDSHLRHLLPGPYQLDFVRLFLSKKKLEASPGIPRALSTVVFVVLQAFQVVAAPIPGEATGILGDTFTVLTSVPSFLRSA